MPQSITHHRAHVLYSSVQLVCYAIVVLLVAQGCSGADAGDECLASAECESQLCYANVCLLPGADEDNDGIDNATEHKLTSHPLNADTDGDGKLDKAEMGADPDNPTDTDFDGRPDLIESLNADADLDCLPDERDANDLQPNADLGLLKAIACSNHGVCSGKTELIAATCPIGTGGAASCVYDAVPQYSAVEVCDGKDNDCDGQTDEDNTWQGVGIGHPCQGTGACGDIEGATVACHNGEATCSSNPDGAQPAATPELCDGIDNDCDGSTDELFTVGGLPVGAPCLGKGECGVGTVTCGATGKALCSTMPGGPDYPSTPEACNGKDDDCDGATDEAIQFGGLALGATCDGTGACGVGVVECAQTGAAGCSSDPGGTDGQATAESCNGKDDNCNGKTDEGLAYNGQPLGATCWGVGDCGKGTVVCSVQGQATCSTMPEAPVGPKTEVVEQCDGKDDDCDGQTDEGFVYQGSALGKSCNGVGACGVGVVECSSSGGITCSSNADGSKPANTFEQCNNVDDDCDGVTDDGVSPTFGPKCPAKGVCIGNKGLPVCGSGNWTCDFPEASAFEGAIEQTCDGKDNDCDGVADEALPHKWAAKTGVASDGAPGARRLAAWCQFADSAWLAGGEVVGGATTTLTDELWRLDLKTRKWTLLAKNPKLRRVGSALACVPGKAAVNGKPAMGGKPGVSAKLLFFSGTTAAGKPAQSLQFDIASGSFSSPSWGGTMAHPAHARAAVSSGGAEVWLTAGKPSKQPWPLQVLDLAVGAWLPANKVPQPQASAGVVDICADPSGTIWALGQPTATGRVLTTIKSAAAGWQTHAVGPLDAGGVLLCGGAALDLLDTDAGAGKRRSHRFDVASGKWLVTNLKSVVTEAAAVIDSTGTVLQIGAGSRAVLGSGLWLAGATPTFAAKSPSPVHGAVWLTSAGAAYRIGGSSCPSKPTKSLPCVASEPLGWRLAAGVWTPIIAKAGQLGAALCDPSVIADVEHSRIFAWGSSCGDNEASVSVDMLANTASSMSNKLIKALPKFSSQARVATGHPADRTWLFGSNAKSVAELWQVDLKTTPDSKLLWSSTLGLGPVPSANASLVWDGVLNRLIAVVPGAALQLWAIDLAKPQQWQKIGTDTSIVGGRARFIGGTEMANPLLIVGFPPGGPPSVVLTVKVAAKATLAPLKITLGDLNAGFEAIWQRNLSRALIAPTTAQNDALVSTIRSLDWLCN